MKKLIPMFLALASLGLMAGNYTINLNTQEEGTILMEEAGSTYTITGTSTGIHNIEINADNITVIFSDCSLTGYEGYDLIYVGYDKKGIKMSFTGSNLLKVSESGYDCMFISYGAEVEVGTGNVTFSSPSRYAFKCRGTLTVGAANIVLDECTFMHVDSGDYNDPTIKIDGATITCTKEAGTSVVFAAGGNPSEDAINFKNSSLRLGGFSTQGIHGIIRGYDTRAGFIATLPDACPSAGTYNYDVNSGTTPVLTYSGPGHLSVDDNNLYFVLPEGNYNVAMGGKTWVCTVEDNDNNVFVEAPEPCFGLLALLALCFLRRK